jgi:riboflavin kinase/FMN adenylyltransferase
MKIFRNNFEEFSRNFENYDLNFTATIGNFDSVHLGHKSLLEQLWQFSKEKNQQNIVITFSPNPKLFCHPKDNFFLTTDDEKIQLIDDLNLIDNLFFLTFDEDLKKMSPDDFIKEILIKKLRINSVIVGENFYFGNDRSGNINLLKKYFNNENLRTSFLFEKNGIKCSSTVIKNLVHNGEIERANELLNYKYFIFGQVLEGRKLASSILSFPTINIINKEKILPKFGVYKVKVTIDGHNQKYIGIANVGIKPTVSNENKPMIEVHIKDFSQNIYNKNVKIEFLRFIREEKKFDSLNELKKQIEKDVSEVFA